MRACWTQAADRPVLFRTLDLGGDKLLPGSPLPEEENPAMGWRSLRIGLDRPALLRRQLRALLLAAAGRPLSVMFPMVATVAEFRAARALLLAEAERVRPAPERLAIGTMLEVPALMWQLPELLQRGRLHLGRHQRPDAVPVRRRSRHARRWPTATTCCRRRCCRLLDRSVAARPRAAGVPLSVCGEAASRPLEAMTLVGLGMPTLSMPASGILPVKAVLAEVDLPAFRAIARRRCGAPGRPRPACASRSPPGRASTTCRCEGGRRGRRTASSARRQA